MNIFHFILLGILLLCHYVPAKKAIQEKNWIALGAAIFLYGVFVAVIFSSAYHD